MKPDYTIQIYFGRCPKGHDDPVCAEVKNNRYSAHVYEYHCSAKTVGRVMQYLTKWLDEH